MKSKLLITLSIAIVAVLALGVLGLGVAFAQDPTPENPFTPGGMMGGWAQQGDWGWMSAMHSWMSSTGGMHTLVWDSLAEALGLTTDELNAELDGGKTLAEIAEEQGLNPADLAAVLESAHVDGLAQAVADGALTQEQADAMLAQMEGRYEWMLENMFAGGGYGMMGGGFGRGGCHGQYAPADAEN
jgi:hypothetical protein